MQGFGHAFDTRSRIYRIGYNRIVQAGNFSDGSQNHFSVVNAHRHKNGRTTGRAADLVEFIDSFLYLKAAVDYALRSVGEQRNKAAA